MPSFEDLLDRFGNIAQRLRGAMNNGDGKGQDSSAQELHAVLESLLAGAREAKQKLADQEEKIALLEELSTTAWK